METSPAATEHVSERMGDYAAALSLTEVALGSLLHGLRVPFSGNFLSLNQGYLLSRLALELRGAQAWKAPLFVSHVAAVLKSLAPAGKKLGPMLSLSMQGFLFSVGTATLGASLPGILLGFFLLSLWTFLQPLLTYWLFFGSSLFVAGKQLLEKTLPYHGIDLRELLWAFAALVCAKLFLALLLGLHAWKKRHSNISEWQSFLQKASEKVQTRRKNNHGPAWLAAFRDLLHPLFIFSFLLSAFFFYSAQKPVGAIVILLLRPLAIGYLFFYFSRKIDFQAWAQKSAGSRWEAFAKACAIAKEKIHKQKS